MNGDKIVLSKPAGSCLPHVSGNYLEIFKIHLSLYIGISAVFGYAAASSDFFLYSLIPGSFVVVLSCGSSALNNIQDRDYDLFFQRTCLRSLPQKKIPLSHAKILSILMIGCGLSGLFFSAGLLALFLGIAALICYNGFYTPLKKTSLTAMVPGIVSGMLPPLIGWTAAGKNFFDPCIIIVMIIFGLWQIPHFFIVLLKDDTVRDRSDIGRAGNKFPNFLNFFPPGEIKLQILIWTALYSLALCLFVIKGLIHNDFLIFFSGMNAFLTPFCVSVIVLSKSRHNIFFAFAAINISMLFFMGAGICDKCFI